MPVKQKLWSYYTENGICSLELYTNKCTEFQANIFTFDCAMAEEPGNGNDVTFLKRDFWYF